MIYEINNVLKNTNQNKKNKRLKILTYPTHESYQTMMENIPHDFYMITGNGIKGWDYHTKPIPKNHYLLSQPFPNLPANIEFDLILSQDRFGGLQRSLEISSRFGIPVIHIDHALPPPNAFPKQIEKMKTLTPHQRVFIAESSKEHWGGDVNDPVIRYGLDTNTWSGWHGSNEYGLSIVNYFAQRDVFCGWTEWQEVAKSVPMKLIGENPGLSTSAPSTEALIDAIRSSKFYLNTAKWSTLPMSMVEAMMIGCPVITTSYLEAGRIIKHGENGFIADSPKEMIKYAKILLNDYDVAKQIGENGRKSAMEIFKLDKFIEQWSNVLYNTWNNYR